MLCRAAPGGAICQARIFGQRRAAETRDANSERWANYCRNAPAINIRVGFNLHGIGHFTAMNTIFDRSSANPYSAKNRTKPVNFHCSAPLAQSVYLAGDFNDWNPTSHPMRRRADGWWFIEVQLTHGHHRYLFLVDDKPVLDPRGTGIARDDLNERVSLLAVS